MTEGSRNGMADIRIQVHFQTTTLQRGGILPFSCNNLYFQAIICSVAPRCELNQPTFPSFASFTSSNFSHSERRRALSQFINRTRFQSILTGRLNYNNKQSYEIQLN